MVYGTQITIVTGANLNQRSHHWGASHCRICPKPLAKRAPTILGYYRFISSNLDLMISILVGFSIT